MAQWVGVCATRPTPELDSPEPTWWKEKTGSHTLSFDLHILAMAHTPTHSQSMNVSVENAHGHVD